MTKASTDDGKNDMAGNGSQAQEVTLTKVLIVDDHALFRSGLVTLIGGLYPGAEIIETATAAEALAAVENVEGLQLVLLDLKLPDYNGFDVLGKLVAAWPETPVAVVSATDNVTAMTKAYRAGAKGYIVKSATADNIRHILPLILSGETYIPATAMAALMNPDGSASADDSRAVPTGTLALTKRQLVILDLMAKGMPNRDIADHLNTVEGTVKVHVRNILQKLRVGNRTHAVVKAMQMGLVTSDVEPTDQDWSGS